MADDRTAPTRLTHTVLAGAMPRGARRLTLVVGGRPRAVAPQGTLRTYLVVLPGNVRRRDLEIRFHTPQGIRRVDFRTGRASGVGPYQAPDLGSIRTPLTLPDPAGGPPIALTRFRVGGAQCVEPGRRVAGEVGVWSPTWGTFLDSPTLVSLPSFEDSDWQPAGYPTPYDDCVNWVREDDPDARTNPAALSFRRLGRGVIALAGVLRDGEQDVAVTAPDGTPVRVAVHGGVWLAVVPSTRALGEEVQLRIGSRIRRSIATGPYDAPKKVTATRVREGGRVVRVGWSSGSAPLSGVDVQVVDGRVRFTGFERQWPHISDEGLVVLSALMAVSRCADVELPDPLVGLPLELATDDPEDAMEPGSWIDHERECPRVKPGERLPVPDA